MGAMFFAVLAVAGQIERNHIREKTLEGQVIAASKGNHGGRPKAIDDDMLTSQGRDRRSGTAPPPRAAASATPPPRGVRPWMTPDTSVEDVYPA
ncbi:hypothetical protein [Streptomyces sp. NBC_01520]|uniref:hypothetical protein n=1 Tax=Streptomyces sp. NBC_01520 TaxID=2903892 RepID=UPI003863058C